MSKRSYATVSQSQSGPSSKRRAPNTKKSQWNRKFGKPGFNPILKYFETKSKRLSGVETAVSASTALPLMINMPMSLADGPGANARIGNRATLQALRGKFLYHNNGTGTGDNVWIREMLIAVPGGSNVSNAEIQANFTEGQGASTATEAAGQLDLNDITQSLNQRGFDIMMDKSFKLSNLNVANSGTHFTQRSFYKKRTDRLQFNDDASQIPTNIRFVYMVYVRVADNDSIGPNVEISYEVESFWKDM